MLDWNKLYLKRLKLGRYEVAAFAIIMFAVLLRIFLAAMGWPASDSDEGTMGLEAMHIAFRGEHPAFLYGQNYMGTIEAYVGAALFHIFGVSLFTLRLGMILLFTVFLASMYVLTSLLYTKRLALVTLALLSVGAINIVLPELRAVGGAVETLVFGTLSLVLSTWLALTRGQNQLPRRRWQRLVAYGCWGIAAGLGLWSHLLVVPFLAGGAAILIVFCWREWRSWATICLVAGLVIGAAPLIYYNVTAPPSQNSLATALTIQTASNTGVAAAPMIQRIVATLLYSLPIATGFSPICSLQELPFYGPGTSHTLLCSIVQGGWSLGYLALLIAAMLMAAISLWRLYRGRFFGVSEEREAVIQFARLMLLCSAGITILLFALSPLSAEKPWSTRYLTGLLIAWPAVLWPLWRGLGKQVLQGTRRLALGAAFRYAIIFLIGLTFLAGTITIFGGIPSAQASSRQDDALIHDLAQRGITRIYAGYWVCDRIIFVSQERIICGVVDLHFKPGLNRYSPYYAIVAADPKACYVFPINSDFAHAAARDPAFSSKDYREFTLDGYVVYEPIRT